MILVRFDRINVLADRYADNTCFYTANLPQVPAVGESVSIKGQPYIVQERCWGIEDHVDTKLTAFLRVLPAFAMHTDLVEPSDPFDKSLDGMPEKPVVVPYVQPVEESIWKPIVGGEWTASAAALGDTLELPGSAKPFDGMKWLLDEGKRPMCCNDGGTAYWQWCASGDYMSYAVLPDKAQGFLACNRNPMSVDAMLEAAAALEKAYKNGWRP